MPFFSVGHQGSGEAREPRGEHREQRRPHAGGGNARPQHPKRTEQKSAQGPRRQHSKTGPNHPKSSGAHKKTYSPQVAKKKSLGEKVSGFIKKLFS